MKKIYDVLAVGPVSLNHNIGCRGNGRKGVGGAVAYGFAAAGTTGRRYSPS